MLSKGIVQNTQFGFRPKHSTTHQIHRLTNYIALAHKIKNTVQTLFLNIEQAFDHVGHEHLLYKLKKIFPLPYYLLLKSYSKDRSFQVRQGNEISD